MGLLTADVTVDGVVAELVFGFEAPLVTVGGIVASLVTVSGAFASTPFS